MMLLRLLPVFALLGWSHGFSTHGLDGALEYVYSFDGRVAGDIGGEGGHKAEVEHLAGAAIRGNITMQMAGPLTLALQLTALEVGSHESCTDCGGLDRVPIGYDPINAKYMEQLNKPFFYFKNDRGRPFRTRVEVPSDDKLWMVNIRKSFINNFQDYFVSLFKELDRKHSLDMSHRGPPSNPPYHHMMRDDTLFGNCESWYTTETITPTELAAVRGKPIEQDLQAVQHQGKKLPSGHLVSDMDVDQITKMTRVIDHDNCHDKPYLVRAAFANFTNSSQPSGTDDQFQRQSTYTYVIRGNPSRYFRIEHMQVEGFLSYNPFGFRTEQLQTITNQTLLLTSVHQVAHVLRPAGRMKVFPSIKQSVYSPYPEPRGAQSDWVQYRTYLHPPAITNYPEPVYWEQTLLGVTATNADIQAYKKELLQLIDSSIAKLRAPNGYPDVPSADGVHSSVGGTHAGVATAQLHSAQRLVATLSGIDLQDVWRRTIGMQREVLIDLMASSGSGPAAKLLIQHMTIQTPGFSIKMAASKQASVMLAMATTPPDPFVMGELIIYVKTVNLKKEPVTGPIIYVSVARILRSLCSYGSSATPTPLYGMYKCDREYVQKAFADYLLQKIKNTDPNRWTERAVLIHTYATLGMGVDLAVLNQIGREDSNLIVRTTAIYALGTRYLAEEYREMASKTLWSNVMDAALQPEVRQSALAVFVSWKPGQHYWNQLALSTWWDSSEKVADFITSTIRSAASKGDSKQSQFAASALRLARPMRTPLSSSNNFKWEAKDEEAQAGLRGHLAWINLLPSSYVNQFYQAIAGDAGGLDFSLFEVATGVNNYPGSVPPTIFPSIWESTQMKVLFKLLNSEVFLPLDFQKFGISIWSACPLCDLLWNNFGPCGRGGARFLRFSQPARVEVFLPNEMGLPLLREVLSPSVVYSNTTVDGTPCNQPSSGDFKVTTDTKLVSKVTSVLKVMVPWLDSNLAVGVDLEKSITLPVEVTGSFARRPIPRPDSDDAATPMGGSHGSPAGPEGRPGGSEGRIQPLYYNRDLNISVKSTRSDKIPVLVAQSVPFTCLKPLRPGNDNTDLRRLRVLRNTDTTPVTKTIPILQQATGIATTLNYEGDQPFPYTLGNLIKIMRSPGLALTLLTSPNTMYTRTAVTVHPGASTNQECFFYLYSDRVTKEMEDQAMAARRVTTATGGRYQRYQQQPQQQQWKCVTEGGNVPMGCKSYVPGGTVGARATFSPGHYFTANLTRYGPTTEFNSKYLSRFARIGLQAGALFPRPLEVVVLGNLTRPAHLTVSQLTQWLEPNSNVNLTGDITVWTGEPQQSQQSQLPIVARVQLTGGVSDARRALLKTLVPRACANDLCEPEVAFHGRAVYDILNATVTLTESLSARAHGLWSSVLTHAYALLYPGILLDFSPENATTDRDQLSVTVYANRSLLSNKWSVSCNECSPRWYGSFINANRFLDQSLFAIATDPIQNSPKDAPSIHPIRRSNIQWQKQNRLSYASSSGSNPTCNTDNYRVRSFDGLQYDKLPSTCYQVAAADCAGTSNWYVFTIRDQEREEDIHMPMFKYFNRNSNVTVEIGLGLFRINGVTADNMDTTIPITNPHSNDRIGECKFTERPPSYVCTIIGVVSMKIDASGGTVTLLSQHPVCGMCGNNNGDKADDNVGFRSCQYQNLALMAASWTENESCVDDPQLEAQLKIVRQIQSSESCNRANSSSAKRPSLQQQRKPYPQPSLQSLRQLVRRPIDPVSTGESIYGPYSAGEPQYGPYAIGGA